MSDQNDSWRPGDEPSAGSSWPPADGANDRAPNAISSGGATTRGPGSANSDPYASAPYTSTGTYGSPPPYGGAPLPTGLAVAALVLGILALLSALFPVVGIVLGIIAVILGGIALRRVKQRRAGGKGMAVAGLVLGVISALVSLLMTILAGALLSALMESGDLPRIIECFQMPQDQQQACIDNLQNDLDPALPPAT